jgi:hypothetical protein
MKVTVNKHTITVKDSNEALERFEELRAHSQWSDTGGGWRGIYRQLSTMLDEFNLSNKTIKYEKPYNCPLTISL